MKKTLLTIAMGLLVAVTVNAQAISSKIAGTYDGKLMISLTSLDDPENEWLDNQKVTIAANDNADKVTFSLTNFSFSGMELGDIVLKDVPVSSADSKILFGETDYTDMTLGMIQAKAKIKSSTSYIKGDSLFADIDVLWINGSAEIPIYVRFAGKNPVMGITNVTSTVAQKGVFTVGGISLGKRKEAALPKGFYIINGKKVIK